MSTQTEILDEQVMLGEPTHLNCNHCLSLTQWWYPLCRKVEGQPYKVGPKANPTGVITCAECIETEARGVCLDCGAHWQGRAKP
jgi:hypothetical protein